MGKAVSLREADLNSQIQGHFVSSFASDNSIKGNFAAYKNSLSSSIYKDRRVSVSSQSPKTLKSVEPKEVRSTKASPRFSAKNTRFSSEVRKRIVVTLLVAFSFLAVLIPASQAFGGLSLGSSKSSAVVNKNDTVKTIVVKSGDTLWSIASHLEPNKDPRGVVDTLVKARGTSNLIVGETIEWTK